MYTFQDSTYIFYENANLKKNNNQNIYLLYTSPQGLEYEFQPLKANSYVEEKYLIFWLHFHISSIAKFIANPYFPYIFPYDVCKQM